MDIDKLPYEAKKFLYSEKSRAIAKGWIVGLSFAGIISLLPYIPNTSPVPFIVPPVVLWIVAVASMFTIKAAESP